MSGPPSDPPRPQSLPPAPTPRSVFAGGGEMAALMRSHDWAATPHGPVEGWPRSLTSLVRTMLASRYPMILLWGPNLLQFYNDAYSGLIGDKHPAALGADIRGTMPEAWGTLGPMIDEVLASGVANWTPALPLVLERAGYREESYFSVSHAPAEDDEGRIAGMFGVCSEVTQRVLGERRLRLLRDLAARAGETRTVDTTCRDVVRTIAAHPLDVPFALIYLRRIDGGLDLRAATGLPVDGATDGTAADLAGDGASWPLARVAAGETMVIDDVERMATVPGGPWGEPVRRALAMPIASSGQTAPLGVLVAGISPNRFLDEGYRSFYELLAGQVSVAICNARAHEEERERAAALAELDRAKTAFFSNVSHEFRTPITLLLGPIEEALADAELPLPPSHRERLLVAHRNALRLLKLVNALLDFSRIEAGRLDATFAPTDLARLTADVASTFRSTVEQAGLRLVVDCPPLPTAVAVDHDLWETIVLNLLSNAFKHTFVGEIAVSLRPAGDRVELEVRDTGVGIPPGELPRLFDRFHRVPNARARTHEGAGIGLALVQELARRHGGDVRVESVLGRGTSFFVTIPVGKGVPQVDASVADGAQDGSAATASARASATAAFAEEALRWLPDGDSDVPVGRSSPDGGGAPTRVPTPNSPVPAPAARILLADDNADMRHYVARLLRERYVVEAVADGATALAAARARPPDMVLADVMMPNLDGYGLLRALRADPRTSAVPVMLLSARAGEEARIEGLEAGADDYLLKPFFARELLARVGTRIELTRLRADLARSERERAANQAAVEARDRFLSIAAHELRTPITAVKTAAHLLDRAHARADANPEREARFVRRIGEAADRLAALTDDLLDVSRVHLDRFPLRRASLDLSTLVREAVERCQETLPPGHPIAVEAPQGPLPVVADGGRLEQVLSNLLENAAKYSPAGSEIRVTVGDDGDGVLISVRDWGIGLSPGADEVIFAPFGRAPDAGRSGLPGLGMGLYISRAIVERHGGRLWAESAGQGRGTTFHVRLPTEGGATTMLAEPADGDNGTEPRDR